MKSFFFPNRIAITTPGKYKCLKANAIPNLIALIHDELSEMRVNSLKVSLEKNEFLNLFEKINSNTFFSLKAITCLSEAPEGRKELLKHIEDVKKLEVDPVPIVSKHAQIAVRIITWKP
jgi:hypothetical protein